MRLEAVLIPKTKYRNKVRWFNSTFGYGYICHNNGEDVFVHYTDVLPYIKIKGKPPIFISKKTGKIRELIPGRNLKRGDWVTYSIKQTNRGLRVTWAKKDRQSEIV